MPELPEVETTRRGIQPHITGQRVTGVVVRDRRLRWPIEPALEKILTGLTITAVRRRAKYLLLDTASGTLIIHLGMSGSLRMVPLNQGPQAHDHVDIILDTLQVLRFNDPRRFGCVLWHSGELEEHRLLKHLGPEPLLEEFTQNYLYGLSRGRKAPVKSFLMDSRVVVGVGNIYANEALYRSGIHPLRQAGRISLARYNKLVGAVRAVLGEAIADGGTTLRDFVGGDGRPGYFRQQLAVYGRGGQPCKGCGNRLREVRLAQRTTVYCPSCQR